ncbi:MAG: DUF4251 domain-containing protein [Bacteroidota bacterium]
MKRYRLLPVTAICLFGWMLLPQFSNAQKNKDSLITDLVTSQHYRFVAQSAIPLNGRLRQLDSQYDLLVAADKVVADLPYFGTAYFSPVNPAEGGIKFTSKDFDYNLVKRKKDGWDVLIKCKDITDPPNLDLTIYSNGKATLQVTSNTRQGISFNGYIVAPDKEK